MNEERILIMVLRFIDEHWEQFKDELSDEHMKILKDSLERLKGEASSADGIEALNEPAKDFFSVFNEIEPLTFLGDSQKSQLRSISLKQTNEDMKIKIFNYCGILIEKIAKKEDID